MANSPSGLCLGASFERPLRLEDGRDLCMRWIRPTDAPLLQEGFSRLSMESRLMRFFAPLHTLSEEAARYLSHVDGVDHAALIVVSRAGKGAAGGPERAFGVARYIRSAADPRSAELAVTVTDDAQGCGLGRGLLEILAVAAREGGIDTFEASVLYGNLRVHALLKRFGAVHRRRDGEVQEYAVDAAAFVARRSVAGPGRHAARPAH
jgi:GNAT superfamily N-acetyltransferase